MAQNKSPKVVYNSIETAATPTQEIKHAAAATWNHA